MKTGVQVKKVLKPKKDKAAEDLTNKNKAVVTAKAAQEIIIHRDLKYIYPKDCKDTLSRKAYRQKIRNTLRRMELEFHSLKGEDKRNMRAKIEEYQAQYLA